MHINEIQALADRLRSLQRRTYSFGKNRDEVVQEIGMIAADLEARVAREDHDMDMANLDEQFSRYQFAKDME